MPEVTALKTATSEFKAPDGADVEEMMQVAGGFGGRAEFTVADNERHVRLVARQDAHFVIEESTAMNDELAALETDARTVELADARAAKLDVLDAHVVAAHDPDRLAFGALAVGEHHRTLVRAANRQVVLRPYDRLAPVVARTDLDNLPVLCQLCRLADARDLFLRADNHRRGFERSARELCRLNGHQPTIRAAPDLPFVDG